MDKRFLAILAAIIIIFAGIFALTKHSNNNSGTSNSSTSSTQPTNHVEGQGAKHVTLVEYGDYECPVCEVYYPVVKQVVANNLANIYFQFRNLPLSTIHKNAFAAARAAEAASLQGKFWQMHDKLYDNQDPSGTSGWVASNNPLTYFDSYAKDIGLNQTQFDQDYTSSKVNDAINADLNAFNKTGQQEATPSYFLDGKYIPNSELVDQNGQPSADKFQALLNAEFAKKQ